MRLSLNQVIGMREKRGQVRQLLEIGSRMPDLVSSELTLSDRSELSNAPEGCLAAPSDRAFSGQCGGRFAR